MQQDTLFVLDSVSDNEQLAVLRVNGPPLVVA